MKLSGINSLYICYFALRQPLVQTQVLPYLRELGKAGCSMTLLTFEPETPKEMDAARVRLKQEGIEWHWLKYHARPVGIAKWYDIRQGVAFTRELMRQRSIHILHARSHVPAAIAVAARQGPETKVLFDIRGFMPEEYVDAGHWSEHGLFYRLTKFREKKLLRSADGFVVLTEQAKRILEDRLTGASKPISVIPCCVDTRRFAVAYRRDAERAALSLQAEKLLVYVGALDGWYLTREMAEFFAEVRRANSRWKLFVATQSDAKAFTKALMLADVPASSFRIQYLPTEEIPNLLAAADAAYCFIKPAYSKRASSPTKIAEYLAAGLPVLCNSGIGDVDSLLTGNRVGVTLDSFNAESYRTAFSKLQQLSAEPEIANRCREVAKQQLDLQSVGGPAYQSIYLRTLGREAMGQHA